MSNYKDYKDAYMVCLRALFGDVLTLDEETFVLLDASFALAENDGDYICSKGFERWLQVQLPYIYGAFLSREDFTKNVYDVMYHFVATGKESALEKLKAKPVNEKMADRVYTVTFQNFSQNVYMQWLDLIQTCITYLNGLSEWIDEQASNMSASHRYMLTFILFNFPVFAQLLMRDENFLQAFELVQNIWLIDTNMFIMNCMVICLNWLMTKNVKWMKSYMLLHRIFNLYSNNYYFFITTVSQSSLLTPPN